MRALVVFGLLMAGTVAHADPFQSKGDGSERSSNAGWDPDLSWTLLTAEIGPSAHIYDGYAALGLLSRFSLGLPLGLYAVFEVENGRVPDPPMRDGRALGNLHAYDGGLGLQHTWGWVTAGGDVAYGNDVFCEAPVSCRTTISHHHVEANAHADIWLFNNLEVGLDLGLGVARESDELISVHVGFGFGFVKRRGVLDGPLDRLQAWSDARAGHPHAASPPR